ncbi:MAG: two-component system, NtrC family, nitrogen regulation sensor histidine kinase NtrY [Sphingomonadales bacterium]|jgi:two-component system nitrogen regulation sensor histidine kinase NtrY|nr:two-component system, NtrC family, nitrogen regulation sensor histidine kinase NtrY [Sphingomonadales bacterium]
MARRYRLTRFLEMITVIALLAIAAASYWVIRHEGAPGKLLRPAIVAMLLVANLVPAMALMVLVARRVAMRRAARSSIGGRGRLHVRLVALFSVIASLPTLMVVIFASFLFQAGVEFWFSDRATTVLANARNAAEIYEREHRERIQLDVQVMGADMVDKINQYGLNNPLFRDNLLYQTAARQLQESAIVTLDPRGRLHRPVEWNPDNRPLAEQLSKRMLVGLPAGQVRPFQSKDRVEAVIRLDPQAAVYFYGARKISPQAITALVNARNAASDYQKTLDRARALQFRFNAALLVVSLLIVGIAIWIALALADRLIRPVSQLVDAAHRITEGDLSARVPPSQVRDEVGTLGNAFNRMTRRLEEQTGALVGANAQLDNRRAFIEAVLSGVTAGVISVDREGNIRLINSSAEALLKTDKVQAVGQELAALAPELAAHLDSDERESIVQLASGGEPRTLAVKRVKVEGGFVLTFDDITEQLLDQRRAAWSDVARRIAHEIKNPLTPIQLAAERLQRRFGKEIGSDPDTFEKLTGTIVRQVGDLRRMVDEFSSFARMPKPVFREEAIVEIARQALFLHEVAHPDIRFTLDAPDPSPMLVSDRRQLGQAITNIVKNGVEAIQQKHDEGRSGEPDEIAMTIRQDGPCLTIEICDTGIGLPAERKRLTEPYMTTRTKGTGLGLAIVKKIVEEHFGSIEFEDRTGGGSRVRLVFDSESLSRLAIEGPGALHDQAVTG